MRTVELKEKQPKIKLSRWRRADMDRIYVNNVVGFQKMFFYEEDSLIFVFKDNFGTHKVTASAAIATMRDSLFSVEFCLMYNQLLQLIEECTTKKGNFSTKTYFEIRQALEDSLQEQGKLVYS